MAQWWREPVGDRSSPRSFEFRDVLRRNDIPNRFVDADSDEGQRLLRELGQPADRLPVVVLQDGQILVQPKNDEVAQALGVRTGPHSNLYDLAVVGARPAGLSAAVYGASEGLRTAIVEREAFGGQAGTSSRIRNYLGFPRGVSGLRLGRHATQQAILFGADTIYGEAVSLESFDNRHRLTLRNGNRMEARSVVIATGVTYRRLGVPSVERLVGAGVFYGAAISEALAMRGEEVFIIGGGNSAGQAAVYLARFAKHVTLLARGQTLAASMSDYLVRLLESLNNVEIRLRTRVVDGIGAARLEGLKLATDELPVEERPAGALFILIGTRPHTEWLRPSIQTDEAGFIVTGPGAMKGSYRSGREPYAYETSNAGVFAVGDVRASSIKRVASAVGEGSVATSQVHAYLEQSHKALT